VLKSFVGGRDPTLSVVAKATPPTAPSWPREKLTLAAAFFASLLLGCGLAVLLEVANPRVSREEELQLLHRLPVLARVPRLPTRVVHSYLVGKSQLPGAAWKGYRTLRAVLAGAGPDGRFPQTILVTSASPGDGKTMTAVNLAITLASAETRVILVDGDLHRPLVATIFHVAARGDGLTGVLSGRMPIEAALVPAPTNPHLHLLLARRQHFSHVRLFDASRVQTLLDGLKGKADVIIIDSPPVPEVAEALELAAASDAVLITVRLGHTNRDRLNQLREMLARRGVSPVGFVVTTRRSAQAESPYDYGGDISPEPQEASEADWSERRARLVRLQDRGPA
jgi:capsular exopolysaccharide synthesis family protein